MSRCDVTMTECDRCGRVDYPPVGGATPNGPALKLTMADYEKGGADYTISFGDLCAKCKTTVTNYIGAIAKSPEKSIAKKNPPYGDSSEELPDNTVVDF